MKLARRGGRARLSGKHNYFQRVPPILTDDELARAAQEYARQHYGELDNYTTLIKAAELTDPPGAYYVVQDRPPDQLGRTGEAGFFVSRLDGQVTRFGSGEAFRAAGELGHFLKEVPIAEVVSRMLAKRRKNL